jgi:hypothetical protein
MCFFLLFYFQNCRILMMEWDCRRALQLYADLTELMVKLASATQSFVYKWISEHEVLVGRLEAEKRLSAVAANSPLTAKHPLPQPPPFKPHNLDSAFDALNFGQEPPQTIQQQLQNKGDTLASPPPLTSNRNLYASPQQLPPPPYSISSSEPSHSLYTQYPSHKPVNAFNFGEQQWQNNGSTPSSPPPPAPNRNLNASVRQLPPPPYSILSSEPSPSPCITHPSHKTFDALNFWGPQQTQQQWQNDPPPTPHRNLRASLQQLPPPPYSIGNVTGL